MNSIKFLFSILLLVAVAQAVEIPIDTAKTKPFGKSIEVNAKIIQLSNSKQSVMSLISGHVEKYYVQTGQPVKKGQKIASIDSIQLSTMTTEYLSLKRQYTGLEKNYFASKALYDKGMVSMQDLNLREIELGAMMGSIHTLASQLKTLGIDADKLKYATSTYILHAHSAGRVASILQPLHSVIGEDTAIVSIVNNRAFYLQSYLPLRYAALAKEGQKVVVERTNGNVIVGHVTRILPEVDETTQRIILLSQIDSEVSDLYINEYVPAVVYFDADKSYVAVKKSALSFYQNEWVVFVPKEKDVHRDDLDFSHEKEDNKTHNEDEHEEHEDEEAPYEARIVKIITEDNGYAAVDGIKAGAKYVSNKSYYVKSMLLKSSLGGHGH